MYIKKIEIEGICCFDKIAIDFTSDNEIVKSSIIAGDNGTGKSTIMRSIALGLCDKPSASGLLQELYVDFINRERDKGSITIEFESNNNKNTTTSYVKRQFVRTSSDNIEIKESTYPDPFPWDDIFVCGYGASRTHFSTKDYKEYHAVDAVYTLFNYDSQLQSPELILRRIGALDENKIKDYLRSSKVNNTINTKELLNLIDVDIIEKILSWIDDILLLDKGSTQLDKSGITINGPWGKTMPIMSVSDGYRSIISLLSDFLGWSLFYDEGMFYKADFSGIVLIDEIEQHLHPSWQRKIINSLINQFPKIQFIFTTHSPLVAASAGSLFGNVTQTKIFHLKFGEEYSNISEIDENLSELEYDQILSSEVFDYISELNPRIEYILKKSSELAAKDNRSQKENTLLVELKGKLKELMFPKGKTLIERVIEKEYYSELEKQAEEFEKLLRGDSD